MKKLLIPLMLLALIVGISNLGLAEYHFYIVSHGGPADPFWGVVIKGAQDAAKVYGVQVTYLGPVVYSLQDFLNYLDSAIAAKPDGIAVTITDATAETVPLDRAIKAGIPVVAINVPDPRPSDKAIPYLCYIGDNEYLAGEKAAEYTFSLFKPKSAVIAIHEVTNQGLEMRAAGIEEVAKQDGVPIQKLNITETPSQAETILSAYLRSHPDTQMIFTLGPLGTLPAVDVVKQMGLEGKVKIGGFDLTDQMLDWIKNGQVLYTIDQQQYLQGYLAVEFLYFYVKHDLIPTGQVLTGPFVIDSSNVAGVIQSVKEGYR